MSKDVTKGRGSKCRAILLLSLFFPPSLRAMTNQQKAVVRYFELLSEYYDVNLTLTAGKEKLSERRPVGDVWGCLRQQSLTGWIKGDGGAKVRRIEAMRAAYKRGEGTKPEELVNLELLGVEGAGHHPLHALINGKKGRVQSRSYS